MKSKKEIGTVEEFHSKKCYALYLFAVSLAKQINAYFDSGCIVFDINLHRVNGQFVFYGNNTPLVGIKDGMGIIGYVGYTFDEHNKVWLHGSISKKDILKMFLGFQIVRPENIEKINLTV